MQTHFIMKYVSNCKSVPLLPRLFFFSKVNLVVNRLIRDIRFNTNTTQYWLDLLENSGIPYGPINNMAAVFSDPQVKKQQLFSSLLSVLNCFLSQLSSGLKHTKRCRQINYSASARNDNQSALLGACVIRPTTSSYKHSILIFIFILMSISMKFLSIVDLKP